VLPETPKQPFTARVTVVDRVINAASGTFGVRLELPNDKQLVPAGAKCKVKFLKLGPEPSPALPIPARPSS
jgi:multidrug efflux pump subunit AcrA (membrane-fusion protein)